MSKVTAKLTKRERVLLEIDDSSNLNDSSIAAKMKRLKIEESHLLKTINSTVSTVRSDCTIKDDRISGNHKLTSKLKGLYENITVMFEDIKGSISTQEAIRSLDIDEIRADISKLEDKMKYLQKYIEIELSAMKLEEKELIEKLHENPPEDACIRTSIQMCKLKHKSKGQKYKDIVASPVRVLITSSLKSPEVQEFRDFILNSPNRFGGWNEYHHNIFLICWNKYFQNDCTKDSESFITDLEKSNCTKLFLQEIMQKLKCYNKDEIISHCKWYSRYVYLKEQQQTAIKKWKTNKLIIKKSTSEENINEEDKLHRNMVINKRKTMTFNSDKNVSRLQYNKPTKQWLNRCQTTESSANPYSNDVENFKKLGIPHWRIVLNSGINKDITLR